MKKIGVIGVSTANPNKGCEALLFSFVHLLNQALKNETFELYLIYSFNENKQVEIPVGEKKYRLLTLPSLSTLGLSNVVRSIWSLPVIKKYKELDVVFALGYGDSFADIYGKQRFDEVNHQISMMQKLKIPVVFAPQTIGPFTDITIKKKACESLNKSKAVFVRDELSNGFVTSNCSVKNLKEHVDMAFHMPYTKTELPRDTINVGLSISALLWKGGYTGKNEFGLKIEYKDLFYSIIDDLIKNPNIRVYITPHVVSQSYLIYDDYSLALDIQKRYGNDLVKVSPFFKDPIQAKSFISGLDFFIGSRMHACIAAFSSGVPVIPLAYSRKFCGLFVNTIGYQNVINLYDVSSLKEILSSIKESIDDRLIIKNKIEEKMDEIRRDHDALIDDLREIISEC